MGIMYRVCDCEDWAHGMTQINGFIRLGLLTKGYIYNGKQFSYCPWCGKQIKDVINGPEEEAAVAAVAAVVKTGGTTDDIQYTSTVRESG